MRFAQYEDKTEEVEAEKFIDQYNIKGSHKEWLQQPQTQRYIYKTFDKFIKTYKENSKTIYEERIIAMCSQNKQSLEITYDHLMNFDSKLASLLIIYPNLIIPVFNDAALSLTLEIAPNYSHIHNEIFVRIKELPYTDSLRNIVTGKQIGRAHV